MLFQHFYNVVLTFYFNITETSKLKSKFIHNDVVYNVKNYILGNVTMLVGNVIISLQQCFCAYWADIERVEVPIQRTVSTHKYCCLYSATTNLIIISEEARMQSYIKIKIHISRKSMLPNSLNQRSILR